MTSATIAHARGGNCDGVLSELLACDEDTVVHAPDALTWEEAACLPCAGLTAWVALQGPRPICPGDVVLTLGTGGVSCFAIQFAKAAGARVIATSSQDPKLSAARDLGADDCVNYLSSPDWSAEVLSLTAGRGVDHVVEVGGPGTMEKSIACTAVGGQIHQVGVLTSGTVGRTSLFPGKTTRGIYVGSRSDFEEMNRVFVCRALRPFIDKAFTIDGVDEAFSRLASAKHIGKVVITLP